jgi:hypothetical protein
VREARHLAEAREAEAIAAEHEELLAQVGGRWARALGWQLGGGSWVLGAGLAAGGRCLGAGC